MTKNDSLKELNERHRRFVEERHWQKHQSPKNLVMALTGEVGELNELFMCISFKSILPACPAPIIRTFCEESLVVNIRDLSNLNILCLLIWD